MHREPKGKETAGAREGLDTDIEARVQSPGGGRALAPGLQREMESVLGADLSAVRVHDNVQDRSDADG